MPKGKTPISPKNELLIYLASGITMQKTQEAFSGKGDAAGVAARILGQPGALLDDLRGASDQMEGFFRKLREAEPKLKAATDDHLASMILKELYARERSVRQQYSLPDKHGVGFCEKAPHADSKTGYYHAEEDDRPYDVDGVLYCGRCHRWIG